MHSEAHVARSPLRARTRDSNLGAVRPFRVRVAQEVLDDLHLRLGRTRWTRSSEDGWDHGTDRAYLRALVDHWRFGYDWRAEEARLDELAQFTARIDDRTLHFVHLRADGPPLLLLHGWPDSFLRYRDVAPRLARDGFDVVVPSLPGFAFSDDIGPGPQPMRRVAALLHRLMTEVLGYPRFGVVGGDGGSALAQLLAIDHPEAVSAIHLTDLGWHAANTDPAAVTWTERRYLERLKKRFLADGGYVMVQSTRPRSLAAELTDSPVGLASWIVDRLHAWSDDDLDARFGKDTLLANVMLYWVTGSISTSVFGYYAEGRSPSLTPADHVGHPVALALFPEDIGGIPPRRFAGRTLAVARWTEMPRGGHFGAIEEPELYAGDVTAFFGGAF
jgi:pimeloyl-ACP methyl ester carboxylesterase